MGHTTNRSLSNRWKSIVRLFNWEDRFGIIRTVLCQIDSSHSNIYRVTVVIPLWYKLGKVSNLMRFDPNIPNIVEFVYFVNTKHIYFRWYSADWNIIYVAKTHPRMWVYSVFLSGNQNYSTILFLSALIKVITHESIKIIFQPKCGPWILNQFWYSSKHLWDFLFSRNNDLLFTYITSVL